MNTKLIITLKRRDMKCAHQVVKQTIHGDESSYMIISFDNLM